jgi:hypothetical protein
MTHPNYSARLIRDLILLIAFIVFILCLAVGVALATDAAYNMMAGPSNVDCGLLVMAGGQ